MIYVIHRDVRDHWHLMPHFLDRAEEFCTKYDSDADPAKLSDIIIQHFSSRSDTMLMMVSVVDNQVVAHLLASIDTWCGAKYATILQYEADKGKMPYEDKQVGNMVLTKWADFHKADIQLLARSDKVARVFKRLWGFTPVRTLMRRKVI
jgi:hypothetical protein